MYARRPEGHFRTRQCKCDAAVLGKGDQERSTFTSYTLIGRSELGQLGASQRFSMAQNVYVDCGESADQLRSGTATFDNVSGHLT